MTSKRSFINMLTEDLKRRIWPLALSLTGFFFALPVLALIKAEDHLNSLHLGYDNLASLRISYARFTLGGSNGFVIAGLMIMAVLNAVHGMKYLHSRQEADFYGSVPVLRTSKFAAAYINGILIALIPYLLMYVFAVIIGVTNGLLTPEGLSFGIRTVLLETAGFLLIYSFVIIAAILTGHNAVTLAGAAVLLFVPEAYVLLLEGYATDYFVTKYSTDPGRTAYLSPVTLFFKMLAVDDVYSSAYMTPLSYPVSSFVIAFICAAVTVCLFFVSRWLIKQRPAEAAGKAMAFDKTKSVIKIIIMIPVAMAFGAFFPSLNEGGSTYAWLIFGLVVGLILAHSVIEIIYEFDFKACIRHIPSAIISAVITSAIVSFFVFDPLGYDTKLPGKESLESAAVYLPGINSSYATYDFTYAADITEADLRMNKMILTDIEDVYTLAEAGTEFAKEYRWRGKNPPELNAGGSASRYVEITVLLRKKNGGEFRRSYYFDREDPDNIRALCHIYDTEEYKKNTYDIFMEEERLEKYNIDIQTLSFESGRYSDSLKLSDAEIKELCDTLAEETKGLSVEYLESEAPVGYISLDTKPSDDATYNSIYTVPLGHVYPSFTETLALLNKYGFKAYGKPEASEIDYILQLIYRDDGTDISERIDNASEIEELLPELISQDYASVNYAMLDVDNNANFEVHYRKTPVQAEEEMNAAIEYFIKRGPAGSGGQL